MTKIKVTKKGMRVFKAKGDSIQIAFKILQQEQGFKFHTLELQEDQKLELGEIYKTSRNLLMQHRKEELSEYTIKGCLYNAKPIIRDEEFVSVKSHVIKGTKKWETFNSFRTESGEEVDSSTTDKANALEKAKSLALSMNQTIHIVVSKRLVGMDGIIGTATFLGPEVDEKPVYVFWVYTVLEEEVDAEQLADDNTVEDKRTHQLSLLIDTASYFERAVYKTL